MGSKTLIGGTAYQIAKGKTLIGGTGYTINKGKTRLGGTGYDINLNAFSYNRMVERGTYWTDGSYTVTFTETANSLKAELTGSPYQDGDPRFRIGFRIHANPGDTVRVTVNANAGAFWADNFIIGTTSFTNTNRWSNITQSVTCPDSGFVEVLASNGNKYVNYRFIEITAVWINGERVF